MVKMSKNILKQALAVSMTALIVAQATTSPAAELRTTSGRRVVNRRVSYQAPAEPIEALNEAMPPSGGEPYYEFSEGQLQMPGTMGEIPTASDGCCDTGYCGPCLTPGKYWGSFELLMWWRRGQELPPLVTTSTLGTPINEAGVLGFDSTTLIYGDERVGREARAGARLTVGAWLDGCACWGVGTRLFALGKNSTTFEADSDFLPILARPFYDVVFDTNSSDVVAYPGESTGRILVDTTSDVGGFDVFLRRLVYEDACRRVDFFGGYQYARIDESLTIYSDRIVTRTAGGSLPFGTEIDLFDEFDARNTFSGGAIGLMAEYDRGPVTWHLLAKVGLGNMKQNVDIVGQTVIDVPGDPLDIRDAGLLAQPTNIGSYSQSVFSVSPEIDLKMAYHVNDCIDITAGYSFIFWNKVALAADQVDLGVNTTQLDGPLIGPPRPSFAFQQTDYFVHGFSVGLQWYY